MNKVVFNYLVIATLAIAAAFTSCKKDDDVKGVLISELYNNQEMPIDGCQYCSRPNGKIDQIVFISPSGISVAQIRLKKEEDISETLPAKTYTANEIIGPALRGLDGNYYYDDGINIVMKVEVKGKTYNVTITGKLLSEYDLINENTSNRIDYKITYKGKIEAIDCD
jgi:hypothetical protein